MQQVKFNKQMQQQYAHYLYQFNHHYAPTLEYCYNNPSIFKHRAYNYCMELYRKHNGYDFTIIGYNCMQFSVGFCYNDNYGNKHFVWITKSYDRDCIVK